MFEKLRFRLEGGFTDGELQVICADAFNLLAEVGIRIDHEGILKYLESLKGVTRSDNRVRICRDLVAEWIPKIREENHCYSYNRPDNTWRLVPPYMPANYRHPETNEVRPARMDDQRVCVKLCDALSMCGPSPLHVQEGPIAIRQLQTYKIALENSREIGGWAPARDAREIEFMIEIGKAAGREPPYGCMEIPISPLRLNAELLAMVFERRGRDDQFIGIMMGGGAAPMPGATAPLSFPAALSQGLAEAIAAYVVPQLIDPRLYGYASFGGFLFNMRTMDLYHPYFPESLLYTTMVRQVLQSVFGRTIGHMFKPDYYDNPGKLYQMGAAGVFAALTGARSIHVGAETGDVFSPLNAIIAADIVRHIRKFVAGLPLRHSETSARELIAPGLESGMYLDQESALNYRELYVQPHLIFAHDDHASLMAAAREEMKRLVDVHEFALPDSAQKEVNAIFEAAGKELVT